jgi:hypothetical protein
MKSRSIVKQGGTDANGGARTAMSASSELREHSRGQGCPRSDAPAHAGTHTSN